MSIVRCEHCEMQIDLDLEEVVECGDVYYHIDCTDEADIFKCEECEEWFSLDERNNRVLEDFDKCVCDNCENEYTDYEVYNGLSDYERSI